MNNPLSNCCGEKPLGEIDDKTNTGRCSFCCEGCEFEEGETDE